MNTKARLQDYAFIGLGANLPSDQGDPTATLRAVVPELRSLSGAPLLLSSFYESEPKDCPPDSPRYVNAVAGLLPFPGETPESLLEKLQILERRFGRMRSGIVNESRTLDLDLLAFADLTSNTPFVVLPHPRAHARRFVLEPWISIVGEGYPLRGRSLGQWLHENSDPPLGTRD